MNNTSLLQKEVDKFESIAEDWWDPNGKFKPLHQLTPLRLQYITTITKKHFELNSLENIKVLDIGCGGGLISEPIARLNANITAIDASQINIDIAKKHNEELGLKINYKTALAEDLLKENHKFQLILALEVIEHIENIEFFIKTCCGLLEKGGIMIFSTMNKTIKSYLLSIVAAEYILKWVPKGTHDWTKFVKPSEINRHVTQEGGKLIDLKGMVYSIFSQKWYLTNEISNNYFIAFTI